MAKDKKTILIYADWITIFDKLEDDEAGRLIKHFFKYVNDMNPEAPDRLTDIIFEPIKQQLKRDLKRYEDKCLKNRDNAFMRWDANAYERIKHDAIYADTDTDTDKDKDTDKDTETDKDKEIYKSVVELYHNLCPKMNKIQTLNKTRKGYVNARISEFGLNKITEVLRMSGESNFLNGMNDKAWKADFDWIMRPNNFIKILEGKYENRERVEETQEERIKRLAGV